MTYRNVVVMVLCYLFVGCKVGRADRDGDGFPDCRVEYWPTYKYLDECHEGAWVEDTATGQFLSVYGFNPDAHDCSDDDSNIHPGAEEICDGADNDCDGTWDAWNGDPDDAPLELDCDGDGFMKLAGGGDESDCDPWDAAVYPGAPEIIDGLDNDCDGCIDNVDGEPCEIDENPFGEDRLTGCRCATNTQTGGSMFLLIALVSAMLARSGTRRLPSTL